MCGGELLLNSGDPGEPDRFFNFHFAPKALHSLMRRDPLLIINAPVGLRREALSGITFGTPDFNNLIFQWKT